MYDRLLSPAITRSWRSIFRQNRSEDSGSRRPLFTNLDVLELHPPVHPKRVSSKDIMTLVQQNPRMRGLRINVDLDPRVLLTMITSHMPHLQDLHLASTWRGDVKVLLEELPECIRTIWLRNVHYTGSCFNSTNGSSNVTSDSADAMAVRRHPALESFVIEGDLSGQDALVLAPFLKSCSQKLKHVEGLESTFYQTPMVVEALLEIGYRWKVLVRQPWQHYLSDAQLADIIRRSAHWTHIDLHTCVVGPLTADAIVENGAHLETLEVFDSGAKGLMGSHLQTVLCRAPHLLSLQAHWLVEQDVIHAADILSSDWVTTSLVRIDFKIDVPRATREDAPDSAAVQSSRDVQRQILRRLGQQKNLQWLAIGGMVIIPQLGGFRHQRNCLEMTLESGLDELAGLKSLEFLDVHHMDHRIGLPELEWMQEHLPNLQHIGRFIAIEAQEAFLRNAIFVRELFLSHNELYLWLLPSRESCMLGANVAACHQSHTASLVTNLQSLELHPPMDPRRELDQDIVAFARQNPGIRRLAIHIAISSSDLLGLLTWHMLNLQDLHLAALWCGDVQKLLACLPEGVQTVRLSNVSHTAVHPCSTPSGSASAATTTTTMRSHQELRSFYIDGSLKGQEDEVLVSFLESCSQKLQYVEGLGSTFYQNPKIVATLKKIGFAWKVLRENSLLLHDSDAEIAEAIARSDQWILIQQLAPRVGPLTAEAIVRHGHHLVTLEVTGGRISNGHTGLVGSHVQTILCTAPHLKTLRIDWIDSSHVLNATEILASEWATTSLEDVQLKILVERENPFLAPHMIATESAVIQSSHNIQRLVLRRFGQQKRMRRLVLGGVVMPRGSAWSVPQFSCLELSLKSGLDELEGLKDLEELNFRSMFHKVGIPELEWMVESLPKLRLLRGIMGSFNPPLSEVVEWLDNNRPGWKT
ncbi:hypothetical protein DFQ27_005200 [Actinomortierella ambigua]|uniref:Uncharacterized protein n=1 Tax=Actinomortierella ambigua TaxID=1343610 RepID=A0A9P6Q2P9_9FUNG|nr:hypothetical protein DFQ27_005200 [Actinomortierella ambigua]